MRILFIFFWGMMIAATARSQELEARVTIIASRVSSKVDKKVFQTLQTALTNFVNNRKWTKDVFQPQEKIKCNFLITINEDKGQNLYQSALAVQAARPVYNTSYESPLINFQDNDVLFKYVEFQPIEFNENRIQGSDPEAANLPAVLAYYINIILGMDYDSFTARGGDPFFQKAQNIVNNAPEASSITGWKAFDGLRNRYKLVQGLVDSRYNLVHDAVYNYYRKGLDNLYDNETDSRAAIISSLNYLNTVNQENPNSMVIQFFFQGKSDELVKIFSKADPDSKSRAREMLLKLDVANSNSYNTLR
jgi:Domain of unknown function (DUF4835)